MTAFEKKVLPVAFKANIGVLAMKPMGAGVILKSNTVTARECLHYTMSLPVSVVITGFPNHGNPPGDAGIRQKTMCR